jgi:ribosomal protein S18 acetylase RimI-like enzyme
MTGLRIIDYRPDLAHDFHDINVEWITSMFALEPHDRDVLENPDHFIIASGGTILFVEADGLGIVGACALMPVGDGAWELTKMGVLESARGRKAGEFLLAAVLARAAAMPKLKELFLLTNHQCEAAIHLYEKAGFVHSKDIMARYGAMYARCDVAMGYGLRAHNMSAIPV